MEKRKELLKKRERPYKKSLSTFGDYRNHKRPTNGSVLNSSPVKRIHFDEDQIYQQLVLKDYDYLRISEVRTPIPRPEAPVEADDLKDRLVAVLDGSARKPAQVRYASDVEALIELRELRKFEFLKKRTAFYYGEFRIAKQKVTSLGVPLQAPGPSIGKNWSTGRESLSPTRRVSYTRASRVSVNDRDSRISLVDLENPRLTIADMLALRISAASRRSNRKSV